MAGTCVGEHDGVRTLAFLLAVRPKPAPGALRRPAVIPNPLKIEALAPVHLQLYEAPTWPLEVCVVVALLFARSPCAFAGRSAMPARSPGPLVTFAVYIVFLCFRRRLLVAAVFWTTLIPVALMVSILRYQAVRHRHVSVAAAPRGHRPDRGGQRRLLRPVGVRVELLVAGLPPGWRLARARRRRCSPGFPRVLPADAPPPAAGGGQADVRPRRRSAPDWPSRLTQ
ncbi:hypothetical protein [Nonomuraea dietziae]|uniref:hypothetical protein n=1 Tax=Nonomuraea dietziae TaxID=65515 RepID=UPI0031E0E53A